MRNQPVQRVLMTGDTVGGVWTFTLELAEALGDRGIEVILATMGGEPDLEQQAKAKAIPTLRFCPSEYKLEWMVDPWASVEESRRWLLALEQQFSPDVIHLNSYGHGALPFSSPVVLTAHSCVLSWWSAVRGGVAPDSWNRYRSEVETAIKGVDRLVTPTRAMLGMLRENYGSGLPTSRVILNGRNRRYYHSGLKEPFVLTAGRLWDEAKNIAAVAGAAKRLPWPVYLAGGQQHPDGATAEFPDCHMLGQLAPEALAEWYSRAAVYALPARYEPFGLSALEAALSGCALVLGDIPSLREVWADTAIFVPVGDSAQLTNALRALIEHDSLRENLARRSTARAQLFTTERMADQYLQEYTTLVEKRRLACAS